MMIKYVPQLNDNVIEYTFAGDVITANYMGKSDTFDFSSLEVGDLIGDIRTELDIMPILDVSRREDGLLYVQLSNSVDEDATEQELYPEWGEY